MVISILMHFHPSNCKSLVNSHVNDQLLLLCIPKKFKHVAELEVT